ncbi:MAG: hypothetical protein JSW02_07335 [candidate division WOR-3 bacterium]|nr:MAG: hypothetical protein JSW02_07335 [candidate division WOR-3 bacterium]
MKVLDDLSPELRDEYNSNYEQAFEILKQYAFLQDSGKRSIGFIGMKKLREAVQLLSRCLEIWRGSWNAMWGLGKAHQASGNHLTALGWFERALVIQAEHPDIYREATIESLRLGKTDKALTYARKACELMPEDAGLQANLALSLLLDKQGETALVVIKEACLRAPNDPVNKHVLAFIEDVVTGKRHYPDKI